MMFNSFGHPFYKCENITENNCNEIKGESEKDDGSIWSDVAYIALCVVKSKIATRSEERRKRASKTE